ncbi:MAG: hypothetical protein WCK59_03960 [Candidatus Falkowbacteria bacterium]
MKKFNFDVTKVCSLFSIASMVVFAISAGLFLYSKAPIFDTICVISLTTTFLPFLATQVTLTAGVDGPFISAGEMPKFLSWLFYLVIFPFVNLWVFTGANSLFGFIPSHHLVDGVLRRSYDRHEALIFIGALYSLLIVAGLIWRAFRKHQQTLLT